MKLAHYIFTSLAFFSGALAVNNFAGLTASNAIGGRSPYECRTQAQWNDLANAAKNSGFKSIRILGFDCEALTRASSAAASADLTVLAGIYFDTSVGAADAEINRRVQEFRDAVSRFGQNRYMGLTIGNENGDDPNAIMNKVAQVRNTLRGAGIQTPVSSVHTWVHVRANHAYCNGDFIGANAHAFFDPNTSPEHTGDFVFKVVVPELRRACGNKHIIITESGWPSRGNPGPPPASAPATLAAEHSALLNLNCACRDDRSVSVFAFEYDDQVWKHDDNERSFGIFGKFDLNGDVFRPC